MIRFALCAFVMISAARRAGANAVDDWSLIANQALVVNERHDYAYIDFAYVHIAIYDAVNAIDGRYSVFAVRPTTPTAGASPDAAVAAAAHAVLKRIAPKQREYLDGAYDAYLAGLPAGPARERGIAVGAEVGEAFMNLRAGDGRNPDIPYGYEYRSGPGAYQSLSLQPETPKGLASAAMKTFAIKNSAQFRAPAPPSLTGARYAKDFNEVRAYGADSMHRDEIESFHGIEDAYAQVNRHIRRLAELNALSTADGARYFAQVYVSIADSLLTVQNSKYFYNRWRPVTAIRAADTDGNPATEADADWRPFFAAPDPEYPAGQPAVYAALGLAAARFFRRRKLPITLTSVIDGVERFHRFESAREMADEVTDLRVYAGVHFRASGEAGYEVARNVERYVGKRFFRPVKARR